MKTDTQTLPQGWEIKRLGDIIDIQGGSQPPKSEFIYEPKDGYIQLLQIRDFGENGVPTFVPKNRVTKFCNEDDILIARYGASLGRIVTGLSGAYNVALAKTIFDEKVLARRFVYYLLQTQIFQVPLTMISRSAQNGFAKHEIAHIEIPVPPLPTQTAIVQKIETLFADIDAGIENLKNAQAKLKQYRQSLLKNAFNGELTKDWREQNTADLPSADELLAQIQAAREAHHEKQLADWQCAVKEWEQAGKIGKKPSKPKAQTQAIKFDENFVKNAHSVRISVGAFIEPPKYGTSQKCEYEKTEKSTGVIRIPNITENGSINLEDMKYAEFSTDERNDYSLKNGDLLLIRSNGSVSIVGSVGLVGKKETDYIYAGYLIRLRPIQSIVNSKFLAFAFQGLDLRTQIEFKAKSTSGVNNINAQEVQDLQVNIFSLAEQTQIVAILEQKLTACDTLATELANQLKQAELLKQSVLKAAFSGRLKIDKRGDKQC